MASEPPPKAPPVGQVQLDEANASLAAIPPDLRGNSWLTLSELSIVSGVPEPTLAIVTKNWGLRPPPSLQIETTKVQMVKAGPYTWFYRPFAADTTLSSNKMQGAKERMENQANMSKYLLSFLKGGTRPTPETMPAAAPQGATWVRPNERCRLSTEACQPLPPSSSLCYLMQVCSTQSPSPPGALKIKVYVGISQSLFSGVSTRFNFQE